MGVPPVHEHGTHLRVPFKGRNHLPGFRGQEATPTRTCGADATRAPGAASAAQRFRDLKTQKARGDRSRARGFGFGFGFGGAAGVGGFEGQSFCYMEKKRWGRVPVELSGFNLDVLFLLVGLSGGCLV